MSLSDYGITDGSYLNDWHDPIVMTKGDLVVVGYIVDDNCPSNPMTDFDGNGEIVGKSEEKVSFYRALGLDSYGGFDVERVESFLTENYDHPISIEFQLELANELYESLDFWAEVDKQYDHRVGRKTYKRHAVNAVKDFLVNYKNSPESETEAMRRFSAYDDLVDKIGLKMAESGLMTDKYTLMLDEKYGGGYSITQDHDRADAIWQPCEDSKEYIESNASIYQYGQILTIEGDYSKERNYRAQVWDGTEMKAELLVGCYQKAKKFLSLVGPIFVETPDLKVGFERALISFGEACIEEYNNYCTGSVYGYKVVALQETSEGEYEEIDEDSCYGYFGEEGLRGEIEPVVKHMFDQHQANAGDKPQSEDFEELETV